MGFVIGLIVFAVILWAIIIIAFNKDLDSHPTTIRTNNIPLPSVSINNSSTQTNYNKNFYNSEAAKYCSSKIVEDMLERIAYVNNNHNTKNIEVTYDFRITKGSIELCNEYRYYSSGYLRYDFDAHRYPPLIEHEDREALAMAICNRVKSELKPKLPIEAKLTYSTEQDDYEYNPSFTVFINYISPNANYIEMKSW